MSAFAGYRCWDTKRLNETVKKDAVAPKSSVFLATHHPATIRREPLKGGQSVVTSEAELLDAFSVADNPELMLFPITGDSGTGKSHLVRWLHAQLEHHPGWKVVYVPKYGTNLRSIVELILDGMEGDEFADARRALAKARDESVDEDLAPERLLDALALQVSRAPIEGDFPDHREYLRQHLPVLLRDPVFREKLLEENGVLRRLVTLALQGRQVDDQLDDDASRFGAEDLPLQVKNVAAAGETAREAFRYLIADANLQHTAVDMLNENLESAEATLFVSADLRVRDVMLDVRRALLHRGLELVLFIEDLTVLHGVQQELLDALVEPAERGGEAVMCKLRAAIAVTRGYFDGLETVRTRCDHAYDLDLAYGESAITVDDAVEFVGRYLNAARLGESMIDAAHATAVVQGTSANATSWVPNACESCDHRGPCHDGFGVSGEAEYGLYPFNRPALDRMIRAWSPSHFDPRRVVVEVIHHTMRLAERELPEGQFPSEAVVKNFDDHDQPQLSADLAADISQADHFDADRRRRILTFWGGAPSGLGDLADGLHEALGLPPLGVVRIPGPVPKPGTEVLPPPPQPEPSLPKAVDEALRELDRWHTGEYKLTQGTARLLRTRIHLAVVERLANGPWDVRVSTAQFGASGGHFRQSSIDLENAAGGGSQAGTAVRLHIHATPENARLLQALVLATHHSGWDFERGPQRLLDWAAQLDRWADEVAEAYVNGDRAEQEVDHALTALLYGARVTGGVPRSATDRELLAAVLDLGKPMVEARSRDWQRLTDAAVHQDRVALRDSVLEQIGAAKGDGGPRGIDGARALKVLKAVAKDWSTDSLAADSPADRYVQRIRIHMDRACSAEREQLQAWVDEVMEHLDLSVPPAQVAPVFQDAVVAAARAGVLHSAAGEGNVLEAAKAMAERFSKCSLEPVRELREILDRCTDAPVIDQVAELAPDRTPAVLPVLDFCRRADAILSASQATVDGIATGGSAASLTVAHFHGGLHAWLSILDEAETSTC